jgi:hypothetical protein
MAHLRWRNPRLAFVYDLKITEKCKQIAKRTTLYSFTLLDVTPIVYVSRKGVTESESARFIPLLHRHSVGRFHDSISNTIDSD